MRIVVDTGVFSASLSGRRRHRFDGTESRLGNLGDVQRHFQVLVEHDPSEDVWVTSVPGLNWLSTYGQSREEALEQTREAILGYFEAAAKEGIPLPAGDVEAEVVDLEVATP